MSASQLEASQYNNELSLFNQETNNYLLQLNELQQKAESDRQNRVELANFISNTGIVGTDIIGRIIRSNGFGLLVSYAKKSLSDPNSISSRVMGAVTGRMKSIVAQTLGINFNDPKNSTLLDAYNSMKLDKNDLIAMSKGDLSTIKTKLQNGFIKTITDKAPEILTKAFKNSGIDLSLPENNKYIDQLKQVNFNTDDLIQASRGNYQSILTKTEPILRNIVGDQLQEKLNLDNNTDLQPLKEAINSLPLPEISEGLKGNFDPILNKLSPSIKSIVTNRIKQNTGIDLTDTINNTPLTVQSAKSALSGNYDSFLDGVSDSVNKYVQNKILERTGITIDPSKARNAINFQDLENMQNGDYKPIMTKYAPQIRQNIKDRIKQEYGVDVNASLPDETLSIDDLKTNSTTLFDKYRSQITQKLEDAKTSATQQIADIQQTATDAITQPSEQLRQTMTDLEQDIIPTPPRNLFDSSILDKSNGTQSTYFNPIFDPETTDITPFDPRTYGAIDVASAFRTGTMLPNTSQAISEAGNSLLSRFQGTADTIGGLAGIGSQVGLNIEAGKIQNQTTRDLVETGGSVGIGGFLTGATKLATGSSLESASVEALGGGAEMGLMVGANIATNYIPDPVERFGVQTSLNAGLIGANIYKSASSVSSLVNSTASTTATTSTEVATADGLGDALGTIGTDTLTAIEASSTIDAVPIVGEIVLGAIGLASLGASIYEGIKSLFGSSSSAPPPSQPIIGEPSYQSGI